MIVRLFIWVKLAGGRLGYPEKSIGGWMVGQAVDKALPLEFVNHLAHFLLAFEDPDYLVGQFIADAVKGSSYTRYPTEVARGILLHRHIDHLTDIHPACRELRALLRPHLGLYTPVAMDLYFDHFLALNWAHWHADSLKAFADRCYSTLQSCAFPLPERMQTALHYMSTYDWLTAYASREGVNRSLLGLSARVKGGEILEKAPEVLARNESGISQTFDYFFPELHESCRLKLSTFATDRPETSG